MTDTISQAAMRQAILALEPFARDAQDIHPDWSNERRRESLTHDKPVTVGDVRKAAAALFALNEALAAPQPEPKPAKQADQPRLTVRLQSFPESNGKRNWTALLVRVDKWDGLRGNCGGICLARGELWNRVAWDAECAKFLIGERDTSPFILDYSDDIQTPEEWAGENGRANRKGAKP